MFTGLVQSIGTIHRRGNSLLVKGCEPFSPLSLGDSVAVDGVCITVTDLVSDGFIADVSEETLQKTTLGLKSERGELVNLEPAVRLSDRLGGHLVSGHVDGIGEVLSIEDLKKSWRIEVKWKEERFRKYVCEKASIALNGISLTVAGDVEGGRKFWIAVIPHTWTNTTLIQLKVGSLVNLEADLLAKYAERLLNGKSENESSLNGTFPPEISKEWLANEGWT